MTEPTVNTAGTAVNSAARVPVSQLRTFNGNPRRGRVEDIVASLTANGQYRPIVVNRGTHTGRPNEVLAGNHTLLAARELGWADIDCWLIDVDEQQAKAIVVADNRIPELGGYDNKALLEILESLDTLDGTGYAQDDLDDLAAALEELEPASEDELAGNQGTATSLEDLKTNYDQSDQRMVVMTYVGDEYLWVVETLQRVADAHALESNAAVLVHLLKQEETALDAGPAVAE